MSNNLREEIQLQGFANHGGQWFSVFTDIPPGESWKNDFRVIGGAGRSRTLYLNTEAANCSVSCAESASGGVIFDGVLFNREDLRKELGDLAAIAAGSDAQLILAAYQRWGEALLKRLRGAFALIILDHKEEALLCLRDPMGTHPMFYADSGRGLMVSSSTEVLLRQPKVSNAVNRAALADYFLDRFPRQEETFLEAINRVPPGHVMRITAAGRRTYRYWDPAPGGQVTWLKKEELEQFEDFLDRAVSRCLSCGPAAIFLSGGLDSVSVAATAVEQSRRAELPGPMALSLVFPDPKISEEVVQRSVATQLGMPQVVKPFYEAIGANGLLEPALKMSSSLPAPLMNTWLPAYYGLGLEGKRRGCSTILTGNGGDEWLTITPYLAADLMRELNFVGMYRLGRSLQRSHRRHALTLMRILLWNFGAHPLLLPPIHGFVKRVAPGALRLRRRLFPDLPTWLAPDPALRVELKQRREEYAANKRAVPDESKYLKEARKALDHPVISWELEEYFNIYQRAGLRQLHPFWDADLVDLLYRTPPFMLDYNGRNKGLVRASLARKFPHLGFERQVKMEATPFYASSVYREGKAIWRQLGSPRTLAGLGIIDEEGLRPSLEGLLAKQQRGIGAHRVWSVLNLETWARAHVS